MPRPPSRCKPLLEKKISEQPPSHRRNAAAARYARSSVSLEGGRPSAQQKDRTDHVLLGNITLDEAIALALIEHKPGDNNSS